MRGAMAGMAAGRTVGGATVTRIDEVAATECKGVALPASSETVQCSHSRPTQALLVRSGASAASCCPLASSAPASQAAVQASWGRSARVWRYAWAF